MPDTEEAKKKEPMVDIDTSGPEVDVDISEDKKVEATEKAQEEKINRLEISVNSLNSLIESIVI